MLRSAFHSLSASVRGFASIKMAVIPGDGIGLEVVPAALQVLDAMVAADKKANVSFEYVHLNAGWDTFKKGGVALPPATLEGIKKCQAGIFGAVSSPSHQVPGYSSPIVALRKQMDLFANLRPCVSAPIAGIQQGIDMMIVRENTECLYIKRERKSEDGKTAIAERQITLSACEKIARMACVLVQNRRKERGNASKKPALLTVVHKANVMSVTDGMFRDTCLRIAKDEFPDVPVEEQLVDSMLYRMIREPKRYDVVVASNFQGDILSDGAAALVGGLGLLPSANANTTFAMAEPVHGSAPDIAGKNIANPVAAVSSIALMLQRMTGVPVYWAPALHSAVYTVLADPNGPKTPDLGGKSTTADVTARIITEVLANLKKH